MDSKPCMRLSYPFLSENPTAHLAGNALKKDINAFVLCSQNVTKKMQISQYKIWKTKEILSAARSRR